MNRHFGKEQENPIVARATLWRVCIVAVFCLASAMGAQAQSFSVLFGFPENGTLGDDPLTMNMIQATDGTLYGTTESGGAGNVNCNNYLNCGGTLFKIDTSGNYTLLYAFCSLGDGKGDCPDGRSPYGGVTQANDGNFYGMTYAGGTYNDGVIFRFTPVGQMTTLHSFAIRRTPALRMTVRLLPASCSRPATASCTELQAAIRFSKSRRREVHPALQLSERKRSASESGADPHRYPLWRNAGWWRLQQRLDLQSDVAGKVTTLSRSAHSKVARMGNILRPDLRWAAMATFMDPLSPAAPMAMARSSRSQPRASSNLCCCISSRDFRMVARTAGILPLP